MGKIRVKTIGDEALEQEQKNKAKQKQQEKKVAKAPGLKGGEKIAAVGPAVEEIEKEIVKPETEVKTEEKKTKKEKFAKKKSKTKSKKYTENKAAFERTTSYPLPKAIDILKNFKKASFDETIELHVNTKEKGLSGQIALPHGTGKQTKVKVADDTVIAEIEKGKIDFDILIATPDMMPRLAKVARILGPRGLMPNPKSGTITNNPEELIEKLSKGQVSYKTESSAPIIHLVLGKTSFTEKQIEDNIKTALKAIGANKINNATLKSTMSPGIKLQLPKSA